MNKANKRKKAWQALFAARGALNGKSRFKSYDEWHDWRSNEFSKQLEEEFNKKFGIKP